VLLVFKDQFALYFGGFGNTVLLIVSLLMGMTGLASGLQVHGVFTYDVSEGGTNLAVIWRCSKTASGHVEVPSKIGNANVIAVSTNAFLDCNLITSVTLPEGVVAIGQQCFKNCSALTSVSIPSSVERIRQQAFENCTSLTDITLPAGLLLLEQSAFQNCSSLEKAYFLGGTPGTLGEGIFEGVAPAFAVYHFDGAAGFASSTWQGHPTVNMGSPTPVKSWLVANHQPHDASMDSDPNQDGVNLLMAYALKLDPRQNLSGSLPKPVLSQNEMSLKYHAGAPGVTYEVLTSTDMVEWDNAGIVFGELDVEQNRTATVSRDEPAKFMRLNVYLLLP
jgi:hypothetical protein